MNIAELSIRLRQVTNEISAENEILKDLKKEKKDLEESIMEGFNELGNGMTGMDTDAGHVGITSTEIATVEDWEEFYNWMYENKAGHMMERRISNVAFREMLALGEDVPGLKRFVKKSISLTKGKGG